MMGRGKDFFTAASQSLRNFAWLTARPKLVFDWYRMWSAPPVADWLRAAEYFVNKDFAQAAAHYERGLQAQPTHPARHCARMDLSYCLYRTGDIIGSLAQLTVVTESSIALRDAYLLRAKIEDILGKPELALRSLSDGMVLFPHDLRLLIAFAHTCLFNGIEHERMASVRESLLQQKRELVLDDNRQILIDAALSHYELRSGDVESGDRMLVRVLATGLAPYEAVVLRGERLLEQRRMIQAREQLGRAMRISPRNPRPARLLAESYALPGDFHEPEWAEQLAQVACKLSAWQNRECVELLSRISDTKGDTSTAELLTERSNELSRQLKIEIENGRRRPPRRRTQSGRIVEALPFRTKDAQ